MRTKVLNLTDDIDANKKEIEKYIELKNKNEDFDLAIFLNANTKNYKTKIRNSVNKLSANDIKTSIISIQVDTPYINNNKDIKNFIDIKNLYPSIDFAITTKNRTRIKSSELENYAIAKQIVDDFVTKLNNITIEDDDKKYTFITRRKICCNL